MRPRLAVLISGSGRTLQNLIERISDGRLDAEIVAVASSKAGVAGIQVGLRAGLPVHVIERRRFADDASFSREVTARLAPHRPDLVLMAGLIHRWLFPPDYAGRVLNIHPALLPKFGGRGWYGARVHKRVLEAGEPESGCTVHYADLEYDHGPVILQRRVPVRPGDTAETLAARVFEQECEAYPEAVAQVVKEKFNSSLEPNDHGL